MSCKLSAVWPSRRELGTALTARVQAACPWLGGHLCHQPTFGHLMPRAPVGCSRRRNKCPVLQAHFPSSTYQLQSQVTVSGTPVRQCRCVVIICVLNQCFFQPFKIDCMLSVETRGSFCVVSRACLGCGRHVAQLEFARPTWHQR